MLAIILSIAISISVQVLVQQSQQSLQVSALVKSVRPQWRQLLVSLKLLTTFEAT